jgi:hypothetical protein
MAVGAILYLWSHPTFALMKRKRKRYPKFAYMQWNLPWCAIIIRSTIKIGFACMHLRMLSSGRARFLCYPCELFTLFLWTIYAIHSKKITSNLWLASHARGWLLDREFDWHTWRRLTWCMGGGTHLTAWRGVQGGALVRSSQVGGGRPGLPLTFGSLGIYIYTYTFISITGMGVCWHGYIHTREKKLIGLRTKLAPIPTVRTHTQTRTL